MVDCFTREQFEAALPVSKEGCILWKSIGIVDGEFAYLILIRELFAIMIRSSIHANGKSASTGKDSIRCWLVRFRPNHDRPYTPWGSKVQKYITRVPGWEKRLTDTLRTLYKMALSIRQCPSCGEWMKVFKVRKEGENNGKLFLRCPCNGEGSMKFLEVA